MQSLYRGLALQVLALLLVLAGPGARAAPVAELWERWTAHEAQSRVTLDHGAWGSFLGTYVVEGADGINRLAYGRVTAADRAVLSAYIGRLAATPVGRLNRDEQRSFWINLYNALTVQVILDHYPVAGIRDIDISPGLLADGPWKKPLVAVEGADLSLDDIEHRILRPIWRDPRLHYAVNCAALGCPNLQPEPFTAANTEDLLERGARAYINHPRGARLEGGRLVVSSIYHWFREDFGDSEAGVLAHLRRYAGPELARDLEGVSRIGDHAYDWRLNGAP
jgi:hypothetical protein